MFFNSKIAYIFVTSEDKASNKTSKSFFKNLFKKTKNNQEVVNNESKEHQALTERLIYSISKYTDKKCISFYMNLEKTYDDFFKNISDTNADRYYIFPLYPQYCKDTLLIANFFSQNISSKILDNFFWIKSFHNNQFFIKSFEKLINNVIKKNNLDQKNLFLLFLANDDSRGIPLYQLECEICCQKIIKFYQFVEGFLYYYPSDLNNLNHIVNSQRKNVLIIPITSLINDAKLKSNTEIIKKYLEINNINIFLCNTLNESTFFIRNVIDIIEEKNYQSNRMLSDLKQKDIF